MAQIYYNENVCLLKELKELKEVTEIAIRESKDVGYVQVLVDRLAREVVVSEGSRNPNISRHALRLRNLKSDAQSRLDWLRGREQVPAGKSAEMQATLAQFSKENDNLHGRIERLRASSQTALTENELLKNENARHSAALVAMEKKMNSQEQDNQIVKTKNHQLDIKVAVLEERCQQYEVGLQLAVDENKSLKGELNDMKYRFMQPEPNPMSIGVHDMCDNPARALSSSNAAGKNISNASSISASWCVCMSSEEDDATGRSLASSWISVSSSGTHCFMANAIFKTKIDQMELFLPGLSLMKGSHVLADDGQTVLEVTSTPEQHESNAIVVLSTVDATLPVTFDHRVPVLRADSDKPCDVHAKDLLKGDIIFVNGTPTELTSAEVKELPEKVAVLKITFKPDKPVSVFMTPPAISTKGHMKKPLRRSAMNRRQRLGSAQGSIPDTEGIYQD